MIRSDARRLGHHRGPRCRVADQWAHWCPIRSRLTFVTARRRIHLDQGTDGLAGGSGNPIWRAILG